MARYARLGVTWAKSSPTKQLQQAVELSRKELKWLVGVAWPNILKMALDAASERSDGGRDSDKSGVIHKMQSHVGQVAA